MDAVIFDLYGTLIHLRQPTRAYLQLAEGQSRIARLELLQRALISPAESLTAFAEEQGITGDIVASAERALLAELETVEVFGDVIPCLQALQTAGIRIGLLSNLAAPYKLPFFVAGLDRYISAVAFSCDIGARKPDPRAFEAVLKKLGSSKEKTLMIGDSLSSDVQGAQRVGIQGMLLDRSGSRSTLNSLTLLPKLIRQ